MISLAPALKPCSNVILRTKKLSTFRDSNARLTAIFQHYPGKPVPDVSILDFIGAKDDGDGGDNRSYKTSSQLDRHNQHTISQTFLQARCPSCRPNISVRALKVDRLFRERAKKRTDCFLLSINKKLS